jgi:hypothetical protein
VDLLRRVQEKYRDDPAGFNAYILKRSPYWWRQEEICRSILDYRITVVFSGNGTGKDYLIGGIAPWWGLTRTNSLTMVTGVSQTLLGSVTFKEIRRAVEGSPILRNLGIGVSQGVKASPQKVEFGPGWHILGFSTTNVERASGQHSADLLAIINEGSGVEDEIYDAVDSWNYSKLLIFGNPIRADGRFIDLIRQAERDRQDGIPRHVAVNAIQIPSTDSPHAHLERSPFGLADKTWLEAMYRQYGRDSLWVRSHIKAEVPVVSADVLIEERYLDWAASDHVCGRARPANHPVHATRRISCDLGEGVGRDSSCVLVRDDWGVLDVVWGNALGLPEAAVKIWELSAKWGVSQDRITYDKAGVGKDFPLHLARHFSRPITIRGYAGAGSPQSSEFVNLRTEAAWKLRKRLEAGTSDDMDRPYEAQQPFAIPPGPYWHRMREELATLTYSLAGKKTKLMKKDDHAIALGHSPDIADALIQSFAFP